MKYVSLKQKQVVTALTLVSFFTAPLQLEARTLKRRVEVVRFQSRNFSIPGGGSFDFGFAINQQIMNALIANPNFTTPYEQDYNLPEAGVSTAGVSSADAEIMSMASSFVRVSSGQDRGENVPQCVVDRPQVVIAGGVISFEAGNGFSIRVGYSPNGDFDSRSIDANVKVDSAQLDLAMYAMEPLSTGGRIAGTEVTSSQTKTSVGVNVNFNQFRVGPQFFFNSPLAKVTRKALDIGINNLASQLNTNPATPWETTVLDPGDSHAVIKAGSMDGVQIGDQFDVYNVMHVYGNPNKPCMSYSNLQLTQKPIATIEIKNLGKYISIGKVTYLDPTLGENIRRGSRVVIRKLVN